MFLQWSHDGQRCAHLHKWIALIHLAHWSLFGSPGDGDEHHEQWILSVKKHETTSPDTSHCNTTLTAFLLHNQGSVRECSIGLERQWIFLLLHWDCEQEEEKIGGVAAFSWLQTPFFHMPPFLPPLPPVLYVEATRHPRPCLSAAVSCVPPSTCLSTEWP